MVFIKNINNSMNDENIINLYEFLLVTIFNLDELPYIDYIYKSIFISGEKYKLYFMFSHLKKIYRLNDKNSWNNINSNNGPLLGLWEF